MFTTTADCEYLMYLRSAALCQARGMGGAVLFFFGIAGVRIFLRLNSPWRTEATEAKALKAKALKAFPPIEAFGGMLCVFVASWLRFLL